VSLGGKGKQGWYVKRDREKNTPTAESSLRNLSLIEYERRQRARRTWCEAKERGGLTGTKITSKLVWPGRTHLKLQSGEKKARGGGAEFQMIVGGGTG